MWTAQHFPFLHPRQLITSGGLGTMGFGLGAAMGAAASDPDRRPVTLITGDGSFRMNLTELSTVAYYGLPVIIVIFNNGTLGMVRPVSYTHLDVYKRQVPVVQTVHDTQMLCPSHMMADLASGHACSLCITHGRLSCVRRRCIHGSLAKSLLGAAEGALLSLIHISWCPAGACCCCSS